jgi:3-oxoacyl-[acyl-carrier protein] reductase
MSTMDLGLAGRTYLLTGASRGLGFATAVELAGDGANVVVSGRDQGRVDEAVARLPPGRAVGVAADLGDPTTPDRLWDLAIQSYGRVDGALLSVGGPPRATASGATDDQWRNAFETVFLGQVRAARTYAGRLTAGGAVALVLSSSVRSPIDGLGISNGLRPGLAGFAKDLADEYGPRGVRVLSLLPGRLLTDRNRALLDSAEALAAAEAAIPLRRLGDPAEFGRVAAFALSPAASYLTGVALPVDGGMLRAI